MASEVFQWNGADVSNEGKQEKIKRRTGGCWELLCPDGRCSRGLDLDEIVSGRRSR